MHLSVYDRYPMEPATTLPLVLASALASAIPYEAITTLYYEYRYKASPHQDQILLAAALSSAMDVTSGNLAAVSVYQVTRA